MASISNTAITFGLVTVPVKVHKAVDDHRVSFHQHHRGDCGGAIGYVRTCKKCSKPVDYADIAKGYETDDGNVVTVTAEELAAAREDTVASIDVVQFCDSTEIPATVLGSPYYLEPHIGKGKSANTQSYVLLRTVLFGKVAVVKFVLRDVPHLGVLRTDGNGKVLVLQQICWAEDIRTPEFASLDKEMEPDPRMVKAAHILVESMVAPFEHAAFTDSYSAAIQQLIDRKAAGGVQTPAEQDTDDGTADVADLLARLEESVARREKAAEAKARHPSSRGRKTA